MAKLENKNINPVLAAVANFCCLGALGFVLIGQTTKAIFTVVAILVIGFGSCIAGVILSQIPVVGCVLGPLCGLVGLVGTAIAILGLIDVYKVAEAIEKGEELDENEYRFELFYKVTWVAA